MSERILNALKRELATDYINFENIYRNSENLTTRAATAARLETIKKYIDLVKQLESEGNKKKDQEKQ